MFKHVKTSITLSVSMYTDKNPHEHLVIVLCTIWTRSGVYQRSGNRQTHTVQEIVTYTLLPACLPPQQRARVLAYQLIMEDKELSSRINTGYLEYYKEYSEASKSIWDAKRNAYKDMTKTLKLHSTNAIPLPIYI
ncbi:MAG: hypothetical protein ACUZ9M_06695 [Candidatus Scalindua sp.]